VIGMGRTEAKSGQAATRPMAATSGVSLPRNISVLSIVGDLEGRDLNGLRRQWRAHLGGEAPAHLPRWPLMRVLAHRLQSDAFGSISRCVTSATLPPSAATISANLPITFPEQRG
jgi:hypothetical protein